MSKITDAVNAWFAAATQVTTLEAQQKQLDEQLATARANRETLRTAVDKLVCDPDECPDGKIAVPVEGDQILTFRKGGGDWTSFDAIPVDQTGNFVTIAATPVPTPVTTAPTA